MVEPVGSKSGGTQIISLFRFACCVATDSGGGGEGVGVVAVWMAFVVDVGLLICRNSGTCIDSHAVMNNTEILRTSKAEKIDFFILGTIVPQSENYHDGLVFWNRVSLGSFTNGYSAYFGKNATSVKPDKLATTWVAVGVNVGVAVKVGVEVGVDVIVGVKVGVPVSVGVAV